MQRAVARSYGAPFNDPRFASWTEADWLREFALIVADSDEAEEALSESGDGMNEVAWQAELEKAAAGDWEALGLDAPDEPAAPAPTTPSYENIEIHDFLNT